MLSILGFVAVIVFTIQVYKSAKSTERNAGLWAAICAVVGIGFQFVLPIMLGFVLGIYYILTGGQLDSVGTGLLGIAGVVGLIVSVVAMVLIAKHVSKVNLEPPATNPPPPPPTFNQGY